MPKPTADPAAVRMNPILPEKLPLFAMYGIGFVSFERQAKYRLKFNYQITENALTEHFAYEFGLYGLTPYKRHFTLYAVISKAIFNFQPSAIKGILERKLKADSGNNAYG